MLVDRCLTVFSQYGYSDLLCALYLHRRNGTEYNTTFFSFFFYPFCFSIVIFLYRYILYTQTVCIRQSAATAAVYLYRWCVYAYQLSLEIGRSNVQLTRTYYRIKYSIDSTKILVYTIIIIYMYYIICHCKVTHLDNVI